MEVSGKSFMATDRETLHTAVLRVSVWYEAARIVSTQKIVNPERPHFHLEANSATRA
jgi:hypothetical protein